MLTNLLERTSEIALDRRTASNGYLASWCAETKSLPITLVPR